MKNSIKKTKTNTKTKTFIPAKPIVQFDLNGVKNYSDMIVTLATAKINAGYGIDVSEFMHVVADGAKGVEELISDVCNLYNEEICELVKEVGNLRKKLAWANRPWYKKLLFWKKLK